jgi:hypothetical protein
MNAPKRHCLYRYSVLPTNEKGDVAHMSCCVMFQIISIGPEGCSEFSAKYLPEYTRKNPPESVCVEKYLPECQVITPEEVPTLYQRGLPRGRRTQGGDRG